LHNKFHQSLINKEFHKFIIGAALKDFETIQEYSYLATHAGFDAVDISAFPLSVIAAKKGINQAQIENPDLTEPLIMVSVNVDQDPHFRRVEVNNNCTNCLACVPVCPSNAFSDLEGKLEYNIDLCYGCLNCLPYCKDDAFEFSYWSSFDTQSICELQKLGANAIEIHLGDNDEAFKNLYQNLAKDFLLESFCIGSKTNSTNELLRLSQLIIDQSGNKEKPLVIQVDGLPLSGAIDKGFEKDQMSIKKAQIVIDYLEKQNSNNNFFVQIAGGTDERSLAKAFESRVNVSGVALGSYARSYLQSKENKIEAIKELISRSKTYPKKSVK
jgi:Fe-S-cluster-containing hydrogenase component 2